jgi:glycosyltransferase involved in cell wall biosynthesis
MRIALVTSIVPFVYGGARNFVEWLKVELEAAGHEVEIISLPFDEAPERVVSQLAMFRMIDLTDQADLAICVRPPAYLVKHPRKVLWLIHQIRPYYDLWDTEYRGFGDTEVTRARRDLIRAVDNRAFAEASKIFTNSRVVSERLSDFNGFASEVLFPPLPAETSIVRGTWGDEIVMVSRLEHHKRQHLLLEALGLTSSRVRLRFIGAGSSPAYGSVLRGRAEELGIADRVVIDDAWISDEERDRALAGALAGAYIPVDEDSYGYPSLEYARAGKPILTTTDSGGVLELVQDDKSGLVCEPSADALAEAMDRLFNDRALVERLGHGVRKRVDDLNISWATVVERLTA